MILIALLVLLIVGIGYDIYMGIFKKEFGYSKVQKFASVICWVWCIIMLFVCIGAALGL